jgi:hypothetical protein
VRWRRRRTAFGEKLRRRVQEIEDVEFREAALDSIEAPPIKQSDELERGKRALAAPF